MPAKFVGQFQGALEVDCRAFLPIAQDGFLQGLGRGIDGEPARPFFGDRQTGSGTSNRGADIDPIRVVACIKFKPRITVLADGFDAPQIADDARKHLWSLVPPAIDFHFIRPRFGAGYKFESGHTRQTGQA